MKPPECRERKHALHPADTSCLYYLFLEAGALEPSMQLRMAGALGSRVPPRCHSVCHRHRAYLCDAGSTAGLRMCQAGRASYLAHDM